MGLRTPITAALRGRGRTGAAASRSPLDRPGDTRAAEPAPRGDAPGPGAHGALASLARSRKAGLIAVAVSVTAYLALAISNSGVMWWMGDLHVYHTGGRDVMSGRDLYATRPGDLPFTYTPWAGLTFVAIPALLPWVAAKILAVVGNLALLTAIAWTAWGLVGVRDPRTRVSVTAWSTAVLIWTEPVQETLRFGQINLLLVALVLFDLSRTRGRWPTGIGVGVAAGLKLTPAVFIPYLLFTGRIREALTALAAFAGTIAVGFAVLPGASAHYWTGLFFDDERIGLAQFPGNQSLNGAVTREFGAQDPPGALWPLLALVTAVVGLAVAVAAARRGSELAGIGLTALTALLVSPISWSHHWVWTIPLLVALTARAWRRSPSVALGAGAVAFALAAAYPMHRFRVPGIAPGGLVWTAPFGEGRELHLSGGTLIVASTYVLAGCVVLGYALVRSVRIGAFTVRPAGVNGGRWWRPPAAGASAGPVEKEAGRSASEPD